MSYFEELGLAKPILQALQKTGYDTPTPIQQQAIPALLDGKDLCGIAQTGTGKTAAFSLPSLHHFATNIQPRPEKSCRMLVLSPTRELAAQIGENMRGYARFLSLDVQCVFGGVPIFRQKKKLSRGVDILVATPGRLLDLIDQRAFNLDGVEIFVLDEADQMMDMGFIHSLKRIDALLPKKRQSLFFSATMPKAIAQLGDRFLNDPVRVSVAPQATTAERVEQYVTFVDQREKQALLVHHLKNADIDRALVFTRTKHGADRVVRVLAASGIEARAIHGNKTQGQRTAAMQDFRAGKVQVLIATDIAARGIDVPGVSHVFNYELPNVPEQYVHRIGRTARAGADGLAYSFCADDERDYLKDIEKLTKVRLFPQKLPEGFRNLVENMPKPKAPAKKGSGSRGGPPRGRRPDDNRRNDRRGADGEKRERQDRRPFRGRKDGEEKRFEERKPRRDDRRDRDDRSERRPKREDRPKRDDRPRREDRRDRDDRPRASRDEHRDHKPKRANWSKQRDGETGQKRSRDRQDEQGQRKPRAKSDFKRGDGKGKAAKSGKPAQHKRGGPPQSHHKGDGSGRNYGPKKGGAGKFRNKVRRAG